MCRSRLQLIKLSNACVYVMSNRSFICVGLVVKCKQPDDIVHIIALHLVSYS